MPKAIVTHESSRELCDTLAHLIQKSPVAETEAYAATKSSPFTSEERVVIGMLHRYVYRMYAVKYTINVAQC